MTYVRWAIAILLFCTPLIGDQVPPLLVPVAAGILLAYDGLQEKTVLATILFLLLMELVWGMPWGSWSLAYIGVALVLRGLERFIALVPWAYRSGWSWSVFLQTVGIALLLVMLMTFFSYSIRVALFHDLTWRQGMDALTGMIGTHWLALLITTGVGSVVLARLDRPFRRRIIFGV